MLKLFRKIRYDLMETGKIGKYLTYAIGEILLVVIGILIALSINNWNQNRLQLKQEYKVLLSLKADFIESQKRLSESMEMQKRVVEKSKTLLEMHEGKIPRSDTDSILDYITYGAYGWYRPELLTGSYDAYLNTGNSGLLRNDNLTKMLAEYFAIVRSGFEDQDTSMYLLNNMHEISAPVNIYLALPKLKSRIGLDAVKSEKADMAIDFLFTQDAFFGNLYYRATLEQLRYSIHEDLMSRIIQILDTLNEEIDLHK